MVPVRPFVNRYLVDFCPKNQVNRGNASRKSNWCLQNLNWGELSQLGGKGSSEIVLRQIPRWFCPRNQVNSGNASRKSNRCLQNLNGGELPQLGGNGAVQLIFVEFPNKYCTKRPGWQETRSPNERVMVRTNRLVRWVAPTRWELFQWDRSQPDT